MSKPKKTVSQSNALKSALENGTPVLGMKGFIHCQELDSYIPVELGGVEIGDSDCGLKVLASRKSVV